VKLTLTFLLFCGAAQAQTISPVIAECGLKCRGEFTVTNNAVKPITAVITPYSFKVVDQKVQLLDLDKSTKVELDATSARISPQASRTFYYKLSCDKEPCMTQLVAGFLAGKTAGGIEVWLKIPHVVYSCQKQKDCRKKALH